MSFAMLIMGMPESRQQFLTEMKGKTVKEMYDDIFKSEGSIAELVEAMWVLFHAGFARVEHGSNRWYPVPPPPEKKQVDHHPV